MHIKLIMDVEKAMFAMNYYIEEVGEHCEKTDSICWFHFFNGLIWRFQNENDSN